LLYPASKSIKNTLFDQE